tara:strand:+ start:197 stop:409 length:213 start_codon:yes stop_codon:yes gene_type:complete
LRIFAKAWKEYKQIATPIELPPICMAVNYWSTLIIVPLHVDEMVDIKIYGCSGVGEKVVDQYVDGQQIYS